MKKSLLALAVLGAFAGAAQAQTSVTIYGSFDAGVRSAKNLATGERVLTMSSNGTYNSNRLGFKGVEDLGGGMNAHFTLETGWNTGTGALENATNRIFNRSAFVGLGGAWGTVDLGHMYSVNFKTIGGYDPFVYKYTGITPMAGQGLLTRLDNDIQYTGAFGPVTVMAEYALGEASAANSSIGDGATAAIGAGFKTGPFSIGGAYTNRDSGTGVADQDNWTVGGAFATGPFRVTAGYADDSRDAGYSAALAGIESELRDAWVGVSYNMTPAAALTAAFYQSRSELSTAAASVKGKKNLLMIGGTYALSKRTNFYAEVDHAKFSGTFSPFNPGQAAPAGTNKQTGFSVGINHLF